MRLVHAWLSISLVTACTGKRDDGEATTTTDRPAVDERDEQVGEPDADAARDPSEPRRRLLLLAHEPTAEQATLRAVELGSLAVGEALTIPAATMDHWPGHFRVVAAHGGGDRFMIARLDASAWTVERRSLVGEPSVAIEVGEQPIATLHMVGERVFVGQGNRVRSIDLSAATPTVADLHQRPEMQFKAYDLFARDGAWLVAIDDQVTPVYADSFALIDGAATHRAGFELPGAINGHYQFALLHATGPGLGTLYAIIPYGVMSGSGHDLVALPMRDAAPAVDTADLIVNSGAGVTIPVLEEHVPRGEGELQLLVGDHFTDWTGLARVELDGGGQLLIAAGDRGLLALPDQFDGNSRPTMLDVGGPCLDVLVDGQRVFVLRGPAELVELALVGDAVTTSKAIELDARYRSFVR